MGRIRSGTFETPKLKNEVIYQLNYISGNVQKFRLIKFSEEMALEQIVRSAKAYCYIMNFRFIFIEPAITTIDPEGQIVVENEGENDV